MRIQLTLALGLFAAGCTTPSVTSELDAAVGAFDTAAATVEKDLQPLAKAEERAAFEKAIETRDIVYKVSEKCSVYANRGDGAKLEDCELEDTTKPPADAATARRALLQVGQLRDYFTALDELVKTKTPSEVATATTGAIGALGQLNSEVESPGFARFVADLTKDKKAIEGAVEFVVRQQQYRSLRDVVSRADPAVATISDALIAYYDSFISTEERAAFDRLEQAEANARRNRKTASISTYRALVRDLENAHKDYIEAASKSPLSKIVKIKSTHAALARRLASPKDADEVVEFLKELKSLIESF